MPVSQLVSPGGVLCWLAGGRSHDGGGRVSLSRVFRRTIGLGFV